MARPSFPAGRFAGGSYVNHADDALFAELIGVDDEAADQPLHFRPDRLKRVTAHRNTIQFPPLALTLQDRGLRGLKQPVWPPFLANQCGRGGFLGVGISSREFGKTYREIGA